MNNLYSVNYEQFKDLRIWVICEVVSKCPWSNSISPPMDSNYGWVNESIMVNESWSITNESWLDNQSRGPRLDMMLVLKNYSKVQTQENLEVGHDHDDWLNFQCDTQKSNHCYVANKV